MSEENVLDPGSQNDTGDPGDGNNGEGDSWLQSLSEDLQGNERLQNFQSVEDLAKHALDLEGKVPQVPEDYEVSAPEGVELSDEAVNEFKEVAKEAGLTQEQFQKLVQFDADRFQTAQEAAQEQMQEEINQELESLKSEWGNQFDAKVQTAKKALGAVADQGTYEFLDQTGMGNHPQMIKLFARLGERMSEDSFVSSDGGGPQSKKTPDQILYGGKS